MNWDVVAFVTLLVLYIFIGVATCRVVHYLNPSASNPMVGLFWPVIWVYGFVTGRVTLSDIKESFAFFWQ